MKRLLPLLVAALAAGGAHAADDWPTSFTTANGTSFGITGNFQYDANRFDEDVAAFDDDDAMRRREFGIVVKNADYFDFTAQYDFESHLWLDAALRLQTKKLLGKDIGAFRVGYFKTPVGLDSVGASRALVFMEAPLATQAVYEGRRTGAEWALTKPKWNVALQYFGGQTVEGLNDGNTVAGHAVWTPSKAPGDVWHLGVAYSQERPDATRARVQVRPEASLTDTRLIDTGTLPGLSRIDRTGLEFIRIDGPWTVLAEALQADYRRDDGFRDFSARGGTVYGSWIVTGESHAYNGTLGNVVPKGAGGAFELLLRYSTLDLNDAGVLGGHEENWTAGANYYLTQHFKFQLNYVKAHSTRRGVDDDPATLEARAQLYF